MLRNSDVSTMLQKVRVAQTRARREGDGGVVFVEETADPFGIEAARGNAEMVFDRPSGSSRPIVGPVIVFAKRVARRLARWYTKPAATQQTVLNRQMLDVDERLARALRRTNDRVDSLLLQLDDLERMAAQGSGGSPQAGGTPGVEPTVRRLLSYSAFEDRHRGSQEVVRPLLEPYLQYFRGCTRVLDLGAGRGEFVDLLAEGGISAYGVDSDESQVAVAREAGRDVRLEDGVAHLRGLRAGEVDGVFSSQVAEHLSVDELVTSIELVHRKLAPGGVFVMETPNPEALFIFATFFYVDLTHIKPIHPEALRWAFEVCGFEDVQVVRSQPVPDSARLVRIPDALAGSPGWDVLARNIDQLNDLIYGYQHYAVVARKSSPEAS